MVSEYKPVYFDLQLSNEAIKRRSIFMKNQLFCSAESTSSDQRYTDILLYVEINGAEATFITS